MAQFFSVSLAWDTEYEIKEFLYRRYSNASEILQMDITDFSAFLEVAKDKEREEHIRMQWTSMLPYMSLQQLKFITFDDYKSQCLGRNIDTRPSEDIIAELEALHGVKLV